jgi:acyl homoserine lactone synthase
MNFVSARSNEFEPGLYDALARYRYRVFVERLGWELETTPGYEQDQFDHEGTVHVVARSLQGDIVGCGRLLPTTDSYLLQSVFPQLLNGLPAPRDPNIWELSRFAAMPVKTADGDASAPCAHAAERVLLQALRFCAARGVSQLLAVSTLPVERLMLRAGVDVRRIGPPVMIGGQRVLAFVIGVHQQSLDALAVFEVAAASPHSAALLPLQSTPFVSPVSATPRTIGIPRIDTPARTVRVETTASEHNKVEVRTRAVDHCRLAA